MPTAEGERAIKQSSLQVLDSQGTVRGCGLLVGERHAVTCAHVVALASSGVRADQLELPDVQVTLAVPFFSNAQIGAKVLAWKPVTQSPPADKIEDIAVLEFDSPAPEGTTPAQLVTASNWSGRPYMVFGFPETNPHGDWADGKFKGGQLNGWVQMLCHDGADLQVDRGFSGAGVWDEDLHSFAGVMVANQKRGQNAKPVCFMIPTTVLKKAWNHLPVMIDSGGLREPEGCIIDIGFSRDPESWNTFAEVRFSVSNFTPRTMKISMISLNVIAASPITKVLGTTTATPIDETPLFAQIRSDSKAAELLPRPHVIRPFETDGFFLKISAEEGYSYRLQLGVDWGFLGEGAPQKSYSKQFTIESPAHSVDALLKMASRLSMEGR